MRNDRGSVSATYAVLALAMLAAVSMVVNGGRRMSAVAEAADIADNAARAGAQAIDLEEWRASGNVAIDRAQAEQVVQDFLDLPELTDRVSSHTVQTDGGTVTVDVVVPVENFGPTIGDIDVTGRGVADAVEGVGP